MIASSNTTEPTQFLQVKDKTYAYHRFGSGASQPSLLVQHFIGTLDNWDPAVTDTLTSGRAVIFDNKASDAQPARSQGRFRVWRSMHSLSWMRSDSNA
jgi:hypothetical protein